MMTPEQIAEKKLLTAEEHSALWGQFYQHASDGCTVDNGKSDALLELIKAQPCHNRHKLLDDHEDVGIFAWKRRDETIGYVGIFMTGQGECCMMDLSAADITWYQTGFEAA